MTTPIDSAQIATIDVGVVVVNWRNAADTLECLESLHAATPRPSRVVVVDNGSCDDSVERFAQWSAQRAIATDFVAIGGQGHADRESDSAVNDCPWLTIARVAENLGFAGGNNVGLAILECESTLTHFLLLNNDAVVTADYFSVMIPVLASRPRAGLCIGTIYDLANRSRVWYAGGRMIPLRALVLHELRAPTDTGPSATEFVTGCAMVISRAVLETVGRLAECYFPGYMEDAEYSWRVRAAGFELLFVPRAVVYHKIGATFGARSTSTLTAYHQNRHRLYFVRRNLSGVTRFAAVAYMLVTKPGRAVIDMMQGRRDIGWATLRGTWDGLTASPEASAHPARAVRRSAT